MDVFLNGVVHVVIQLVDICISIARASNVSLHISVMPTVWGTHDDTLLNTFASYSQIYLSYYTTLDKP